MENLESRTKYKNLHASHSLLTDLRFDLSSYVRRQAWEQRQVSGWKRAGELIARTGNVSFSYEFLSYQFLTSKRQTLAKSDFVTTTFERSPPVRRMVLD